MSDIFLRSNYLAKLESTYLEPQWSIIAPLTGPFEPSPIYGDLYGAGTEVLTKLQAIGPIPGEPGNVRGLAVQLAEFAQNMQGVHGNLAHAASTYLPGVWVGAAANSANDLLSAMAHDTSRWADTVRPCKGLLETLADNLAAAQQDYNLAWGDVEARVSDLLDNRPTTWDEIKATLKQMMLALQRMADAASAAEKAGQDTAQALAARTLPLRQDDMDPIVTTPPHQDAMSPSVDSTQPLEASDWLVLTDQANSAGDPFAAMNDVQYGRTRMAQLSPDDSATFNALLVQADTPAEKAQLLRELGRGTPVDQIHDRIYPPVEQQARQRHR